MLQLCAVNKDLWVNNVLPVSIYVSTVVYCSSSELLPSTLNVFRAAVDVSEWSVRPTAILTALLSFHCRVDATVARYDAVKKRLSDLEESDRTTCKLEEKMADIHKRFQTVLSWKLGKVSSTDADLHMNT